MPERPYHLQVAWYLESCARLVERSKAAVLPLDALVCNRGVYLHADSRHAALPPGYEHGRWRPIHFGHFPADQLLLEESSAQSPVTAGLGLFLETVTANSRAGWQDPILHRRISGTSSGSQSRIQSPDPPWPAASPSNWQGLTRGQQKLCT